jgi:hypothetical protein
LEVAVGERRRGTGKARRPIIKAAIMLEALGLSEICQY